MTRVNWQRLTRDLECKCWDCLRDKGLTPPTDLAPKHPDVLGVVYSSYNGQAQTLSRAAAESEAA